MEGARGGGEESSIWVSGGEKMSLYSFVKVEEHVISCEAKPKLRPGGTAKKWTK